MSNFLRRLPRSRLLLLCATIVAVGAGATALAVALGTGPVPPPKPLAQAVHDALAAPPVDGVSARIQLTDHLLEASSLQSEGGAGGAGGVAANPLLTGASGRLWIAADGRIRVELQAEQGDTQVFYDGHTISLYDAASNSLYRYKLPPDAGAGAAGQGSTEDRAGTDQQQVPTVTEIQEAIVRIMRNANLSGAVPTDVAGQPAYAVRISPSQNGGLIGGAELAWDAVHGVPLRLAVYSTTSTTPVLEASATEVSYGAVPDSVFAFTPPPGVQITEVEPPAQSTEAAGSGAAGANSKPAVEHVSGLAATQAAMPFALDAPPALAGMTRSGVQAAKLNGHSAALVTYGQGLGGIAVLESSANTDGAAGSSQNGQPSDEAAAGESLVGELPKVSLPGASATELPTPLGTLLRFQRAGVDYILAGSVTPATLQDAAKGL